MRWEICLKCQSYNDMMGWACVRDLAPLIKQWEVQQIDRSHAAFQALEQKSEASEELLGAERKGIRMPGAQVQGDL